MSKLPFEPFVDERVTYTDKLGSDLSGRIFLTTFRLYARPTADRSFFYNVPIRLIDYSQLPSGQVLRIYCRHGFAFTLEFPDAGAAAVCLLEIADAADSCQFRPTIEFEPFDMPDRSSICLNDLKRLGLTTGPFKVSTANEGFRICQTYPEYVCVAATVSDEDLLGSAKFRAQGRFVSIVYRHGPNGTCMARSSQPGLGILCYRNVYDEMILRSLASSGSGCSGNDDLKALNIVDARDGTAAYLNRARGGGYEVEGYYSGSKIHFMQIPNIHTVRTAFNAMRDVICETKGRKGFAETFLALEWPKYISLLIESARFVTESIHRQGIPVLVHCSDGWDRTPQIVSLAKLCLDPYYRTFRGFVVLIETEWVAYGHRFTSRCQSNKDSSERSPVFLQWLDCVYQLLNLYPKCFEFNERLLSKTALHCYLALFDTFTAEKDPADYLRGLRNGSENRCDNSQPEDADRRMNSLWAFLLGQEEYLNPAYEGSRHHKVLFPSVPPESCLFWRDVYLHGGYEVPPAKYVNAGRTKAVQMCDYWNKENFAGREPSLEDGALVGMTGSRHLNSSQPNGFCQASHRLSRRNSDPVLVWADSPPGNQDPDFLPSRSPFELLDLDRALCASISKSDNCISTDMSPSNSFMGHEDRGVSFAAKSVLSLLDGIAGDSGVDSLRQKLTACIQKEETLPESPIDIDGLLINAMGKWENRYCREYLSVKARSRILENAVQALCNELLKLLKEKGQTITSCSLENSNVQPSAKELSSMSVGDDTVKLGKSGECSQCGNKLRWILKPRQRCRLCYQTFCKSCCDNVVTLAASSEVNLQEHLNDQRSDGSLVQLAFRICEKCIKLYAGRHLKPLTN